MFEINPRNTFLFSDPHFDHANIIRYCKRPFKNVELMNKTILNNYNKVVKDNSLVFFLGDMAFLVIWHLGETQDLLITGLTSSRGT